MKAKLKLLVVPPKWVHSHRLSLSIESPLLITMHHFLASRLFSSADQNALEAWCLAGQRQLALRRRSSSITLS